MGVFGKGSRGVRGAKPPARLGRWQKAFLLSLLVAAGGGVFLWMNTKGFSCQPSMGVMALETTPEGSPKEVAAFQEAKSKAKAGQTEEALKQYASLVRQYPRLQPLILFHEAELQAALGREDLAERLYQQIIGEYQKYPSLVTLAQYEAGRSYLRSHQNDEAHVAFDAVLKLRPQSNLALGAHYYLGELAVAEDNLTHAETHWRTYLDKAPDGTFSLAAVKGLEAIPSKKHPEDYRVMGQAWFDANEPEKALTYLKQAPSNSVWLTMGRALMRTGHVSEGRTMLETALRQPVPDAMAQDAIQSILSSYPSIDLRKATLKRLWASPIQSGRDFLLYRLAANAEGAVQRQYLAQLVNTYPKSPWAPESSWALMWPVYRQNRFSDFIERANHHLQLYPTSISAPRVLFWKAKAYLAQSQPEAAHDALKKLVTLYPRQYYAFRAQQILDNTAQPWKTSIHNVFPDDVGVPKPDPKIAQITAPDDLEPVVQELIRVGAADDLRWLMSVEPYDRKESPLDAAASLLEGKTAEALRTMHNVLDDRRKAGHPLKSLSLYRMAYPLMFTQAITPYAQKNRLDSWLVLALMRQESHFNPQAISSSNALGLMQLLPSTARDVAKWESLSGFAPALLFSPEVNIRLGTRYLGFLHQQFGGSSPHAVGAYNGGPGAMARWKAAIPTADLDLFIESIPYDQSRDYIKEVYTHYWLYKSLYPTGHSEN